MLGGRRFFFEREVRPAQCHGAGVEAVRCKAPAAALCKTGEGLTMLDGIKGRGKLRSSVNLSYSYTTAESEGNGGNPLPAGRKKASRMGVLQTL